MGDIFTDANNDRCDKCGKKYNVNFAHECKKIVDEKDKPKDKKEKK